ncbi:HAMP domain-containing sensor histidine kinase [Streptomyces sp. NPDC091265]|uniref:sensor histidine kinase n=1 Tax=unclassified Streptomyces TaxID=2593676 RepID=UPI00344BF09B
MRLFAARFGLRTRLIAAFLFVAAVSAATTATLTYREARSAILQQAQDTAVAQFRDRVGAQGVSLPLDRVWLRDMCLSLAREGKSHTWTVFAEYGNLRVSSSDRPSSGVITPGLRAAARDNSHGSFQRVVKDGRPWLTVGMPTLFDRGDGRQPTGLVLYAVMPLATEEANVEAMVTAARDGALPALLIALVPALLAARSVLRPVRDSHELRTPLAGMLAVTEVLDEDAGELRPDTAAAVRLISSETVKLATLVEDLMEISRFDAGAADLHLDEVDVGETIRKTLQGRHWEDRVHTELPTGVRAVLDPRRFDVIVANLVGNALRHGAGPVTVRLRTEQREGRGRLVTEIADSGPGIDAAVLPHIFDRFYKADAARTRSAGSGLGLAITQENVRLHGGTVHAVNGPSGGAVLTVELPLAER